MTHEIKTCQCPPAVLQDWNAAPELVDYLRELIERIQRGEIRHVSVSVHPK